MKRTLFLLCVLCLLWTSAAFAQRVPRVCSAVKPTPYQFPTHEAHASYTPMTQERAYSAARITPPPREKGRRRISRSQRSPRCLCPRNQGAARAVEKSPGRLGKPVAGGGGDSSSRDLELQSFAAILE